MDVRHNVDTQVLPKLPCMSAAIGCVVFLFVVCCCCCGGVIVILVVADVIQVDVAGNVQTTVVIL